MTITCLRIADFRNLSIIELEPCHSGVNIIHGDNGSGKTSLLEAIYYLGLGRSFRSSNSGRLIRHSSDKFSLFAQLLNESDRSIPVGVEREANGTTRLRVAEKDVSTIAEVAGFLPLRIIDSHSHNIFEAGPTFRRKYLDWGLFYQSESFLPTWRQFERVLKQRNALLKERKPKREVDAWTEELIRHGVALHQLRETYVNQLAPLIRETTDELLTIEELEIHYLPGWDESLSYEAALTEGYLEEYRYGCTQFGPQRADLEISIQGIPVKHFLSRGQQKLLICAMIVAQGKLLTQQTNNRVIYLVDDLPSELDTPNRDKLISLLARQNTQVFLTAIEKDAIYECVSEKLAVPVKVFHVEHGNVVELTS